MYLSLLKNYYITIIKELVIFILYNFLMNFLVVDREGQFLLATTVRQTHIQSSTPAYLCRFARIFTFDTTPPRNDPLFVSFEKILIPQEKVFSQFIILYFIKLINYSFNFKT